ncbi:sigma-54-dependent transcriptional regulator [Vibrio tapetis]|uniref:PgtA n=1 Tax=Vibrio tapetis subsp. tapetis TaxID=1671868 RepID=A0A2N8ZMX1_9VIBR|nr:sigma-54 dependent transcriptional regulator [Vibrio tapetis]SON53274.1 PgtA [Vibrio tapetis subsp. tapetis]
MSDYSVLLVDDDQDVLDSYSHLMSIANLKSKALIDPTLTCHHIDTRWSGVVVIDMYMPQMHGMDLLKIIKTIDSDIPVIVITGHGDIPMAVEAVKIGANDFLEKPINPSQLLELIKKHLGRRQLFVQQKCNLDKSIKKELIGKSAQMENIREHIAQLAMLRSHVVITGESGVGRRSIAYLIHQLNETHDSGTLIELEGSQVTNIEQLDQQLDAIDSGTIILSRLEKLDESIQQHLTQYLLRQERLTKNKIRLIGLFRQDPESLIQNQQLHPELYYLISQGIIEVPPLRLRPDDIATLFHYYLKISCNKLAKAIPEVSSQYLQSLRNHSWPGNVRELRNVAELYAIGIIKLAGQDRIKHEEATKLPLDCLVDGYEKQLIEDALFLFSGRVNDVAVYLQVPRKKLYLRMKKHGIDKDNFKTRG